MAIERKWEGVSQPFVNNGTINGVIVVPDASGFFAKQKVTLTSNTQPPKVLEVRRVTATSVQVGEVGQSFDTYADVTAYTIAASATITAPEQQKPIIKPDEIWQAVYSRDPAVALRNLLVSKFGVPIDTVIGVDGRTRLAVDAAVSVAGLSVELDALTPPTRPDPDNILIAGSEDGTKTGLKHAARIDSDLDLRVGISNGANKAGVNPGGELSVTDATTHTTLSAINTKITSNVGGEILVHDTDVLTAVTAILGVVNGVLKGLNIGTEDGTPTGIQRVFVNNFRQQILATHNRVAAFTYADFGTKDQRITQVNYTSTTFPGITIQRQFAYSLVGTRYRRDNETWNVV